MTIPTMKILYEDVDILVVCKPVGALSEVASDGTPSVPMLLSEHASDAFPITPITRLDRNVGGVMLLAKTKKAATFLSAEVSDHQRCIKEYRAVVEGSLAEREGELTDLLFKDSHKNKSFVVKRMRKGVKSARLAYKLLCTSLHREKQISLLAIRLYTGRTHQIRVQLSHRAHPLLGDGKYGGDSFYPLSLHAYALTFDHPDGRRMRFEVEMPDGLPWNLFSEY